MLSEETTNTNFIVFGLSRPGRKPTIYRTRGEHANHYTTDDVRGVMKDPCIRVVRITLTSNPLNLTIFSGIWYLTNCTCSNRMWYDIFGIDRTLRLLSSDNYERGFCYPISHERISGELYIAICRNINPKQLEVFHILLTVVYFNGQQQNWILQIKNNNTNNQTEKIKNDW